MESFIIWAAHGFVEEEIQSLTQKYQVDPYNRKDISFIEKTGIDEVRELKHLLRLSHSGSGNRMIVLADLDCASIPSQNALLKLLEEPPDKTILIVTCENIHALLETIVSRCTVLKVKQKKSSGSTDNNTPILAQILSASPGQRLILSSKAATTREKAIEFLDTISYELYEKLHHEKDKNSIKNISGMLTRTQKAKQYIDANVNAKAVVDVLLLGFPSSPPAGGFSG